MFDFGERLYELRSKNNMSQGDLADRLDVSRQTISKWENGACLPEAEKLVLLSDVLGVSVDYILKGEQKQPEPVYVYVKDTNEYSPGDNEPIVRKYVGIVLAVVFSLVTVVILLMGGSFLAIIPGAAAFLGILFAVNVKHPWLTTFWSFYIAVLVIAPFVSSISLLMILDPIIYEDGYTAHLLWSYGLWLVLEVLVLATVKAKRGYVFKRK